MDNIRNYLTPIGAAPWIFKGDSQPYVTPMTKGSLVPMSKSSAGRSWEKKFENMRGRESIGFELSVSRADFFSQLLPADYLLIGTRLPFVIGVT